MLGIPFLDNVMTTWFKPQTFDDPVDRLNYFITPTLLTFFALMVSAKQYVGAPIQCWVPMEFKGGWEQYAEDYCFIQNTYFLPIHKQIPQELDMRTDAEIGYYQWVPIVLAIQAIMFYIPNWLWKTLHQQSGLDLQTAITDARKLRAVRSPDERRTELLKLTAYIEECLDFAPHRSARHRVLCVRFGANLGSFVSMLYLAVKALYVVNIIGQFFLLNGFLGSSYNLWGIQVFNDLVHGREWQESGVFPRVTLCDFTVRRLANLHRYTVQCVLMINMFNEKIYLFIWFWFLFVAVSTVINFIYCLITMIPASAREHRAAQLLRATKFDDLTDSADDRRIIRRFVHNGLRPDGLLLLRFVDGHAGAIVARDLSAQLFADFAERTLIAPNMIRNGGGVDAGGGGSHSTKSTSPGVDDGFSEQLYEANGGKTSLLPNNSASAMSTMLAVPDSGYPGPPPSIGTKSKLG